MGAPGARNKRIITYLWGRVYGPWGPGPGLIVLGASWGLENSKKTWRKLVRGFPRSARGSIEKFTRVYNGVSSVPGPPGVSDLKKP